MAVKCLLIKLWCLNHKEHHGENRVNGKTKSPPLMILHTTLNQCRLPIRFTMADNDMFLFKLLIDYHLWFKHKSLVVNTVPSQPPTAFQLTANSSTSIIAYWQLPPVFARHGNIIGFRLFYKRKGSGGSATTLSISDGATFSRTVRGLDKYTEYIFQVLAFTSDGNGAKSSAKVKRTMEDGMC